jgi:hypothetical protein
LLACVIIFHIPSQTMAVVPLLQNFLVVKSVVANRMEVGGSFCSLDVALVHKILELRLLHYKYSVEYLAS